MSNVYGFVDRDPQNPVTSSNFMVCTEILESILKDPDASILISDQPGCGIFIARYLKGCYYRNAVLYHVGEKPRVNLGDFPTKGGFTSLSEVRAQIADDSSRLIEI